MIRVYFLLLLFFSFPLAASGQPHTAADNYTVIEGTLLQVSKLPEAVNNPYPDCYFTALVEISHIVSGQSIPKKVILVLPGFFSRQYTPQSKLKIGDMVRATLIPFALMPNNVKETQQADEIEDVDLEFYFPKLIVSVQQLSQPTSLIPFKATDFRINKPRVEAYTDNRARYIRQETMRQDLKQIQQLLVEHGGDWDQWYHSLKDFRAKYWTQSEIMASKWIGDSYFSAGQLPHNETYVPEFVKSIVAFKNYLADRGVDLIVVRFPYKGEIVDDLFAPLPSDGISNPYLLRMYKELIEADVEIVTDIIPRAKNARLKYPLMYWYQDFTEPHPAEGMVWIVAEALSERLKRYEKVRSGKTESFAFKRVSASIMSRPASKFSVWPNNVFWPEGNPRFNSNDYVQFDGITTKQGTALSAKEGLESPVLVVGSSFVRYPSNELGATLSTYLAYLLGFVPDTLSRLGADQSIPRTIVREGDDLLRNRSVCVFPIVPWAFYSALDSAPISNPDTLKKTLLSTIAGSELKRQIQIKPGTPAHVFSFSKEGSLDIAAADLTSRRGFAGTFQFTLPKQISQYPYIVVEIESKPGDAPVFLAKYGTTTFKIQKFYSQKNIADTFIFKPLSDLNFQIVVDSIEPSFLTSISSIKIYGGKS